MRRSCRRDNTAEIYFFASENKTENIAFVRIGFFSHFQRIFYCCHNNNTLSVFFAYDNNRYRHRAATKQISNKMNKSDDESCCTDYETDGFWSTEKTLLESMKGVDGEGTTVRRRKKKKAKNSNPPKDRVESGEKVGLRQRWRDFLREHDEEWHDFWRIGHKCFVDTVRRTRVFFFYSYIIFLSPVGPNE